MIDLSILAGFLAALVRASTPLLWAGLGEVVVERSGVINLGVEGAMLAGALAAAIGAAAGGPWAGVLAAAVAGTVVAAVFAGFAIVARANQIIVGTAVTLGATGLTGLVYRRAFGATGTGLNLPTLGPFAIPGLDRIPVIGEAFFRQPILTPLAWVTAGVLAWWLGRTRAGLALRAAGESPEAARAAGVQVERVRVAAVLFGGFAAGLGGATLVLAQVGAFAEKMTAGRGFIAIAIVVLGRWRPMGVLGASLLFGGASALQFLFQAMNLGVPYQWFLMLPSLLGLGVLAGAIGPVRAPARLSHPIRRTNS